MLAVITSHPIQYQAPLWRAITDAGVDLEVWFLTPHAVKPTFDKEFGQTFAWDLDLLSGYRHRFLNVASGWDLNRFRGIRVLDRWQDLFRERGVTHLWIEGWRFSALWSAARAARRNHIKVWLRGETNDLSRRGRLKSLGRQIALTYYFRNMDRFLTIGEANRRFYRSFRIPESRFVSTPYCVDNDRFEIAAKAARPRRKTIRERWGIPDNQFCVLFCGKFIDKKRPMDLVKAASLQTDQVHLLFVGDGEHRQQLHEVTNVAYSVFTDSKLGGSSGPSASFVGFLNQEEIVDAYVAADCLVLASDSGETWGLVVNEAMATGLPCIVSNQCGCAEDLTESRFIFEMGNIAELSECIRTMRSSVPAPAEVSAVVQAFHPQASAKAVAAAIQL